MEMLWIPIIMLAFSALLLSGRGEFLIAGRRKHRARNGKLYNKKKQCKVTGAGMLVVTVLFTALLFMESAPRWFDMLVLVAVLADALIVVYLLNNKCYLEDGEQIGANLWEED